MVMNNLKFDLKFSSQSELDENANVRIRKKQLSTRYLLIEVLGDRDLADGYDRLKIKGGKDFLTLKAKIEVKLTLRWEEASNRLKEFERKALEEDDDFLWRYVEYDKE